MNMFIIILYILIILSFIGLVIQVIRKIPVLIKLSNEEIAILSNKKSSIQKCREINFRQHFFHFIVKLEKFLRKIKIIFLKIENILGKWIDKLSSLSRIMARKSKEWIRRKEKKQIEKKNGVLKSAIKRKEIEIIDKTAVSFSELEKPTKEEQKWIDLIVENPKNITAYKLLGLLYWKQHNYADARASLEMAVKLGSKDKKIKEIIKQIKKEQE